MPLSEVGGEAGEMISSCQHILPDMAGNQLLNLSPLNRKDEGVPDLADTNERARHSNDFCSMKLPRLRVLRKTKRVTESADPSSMVACHSGTGRK